MPESERQIVMRFNKISLEHARAFRAELGSIIVEHAAKGLLNSGYTVKRSYKALQNHLDQAVDESLQLISNKTRHAGRKRKRLLNHLRDQVRHHTKGMEKQIDDNIIQRLKLGGDAAASAELLARQCLEAALDRIDKYQEGLTAPKDERWHSRHPFLAGALVAIITSLVGLAVAFVPPLLN